MQFSDVLGIVSTLTGLVSMIYAIRQFNLSRTAEVSPAQPAPDAPDPVRSRSRWALPILAILIVVNVFFGAVLVANSSWLGYIMFAVAVVMFVAVVRIDR